MHVTYTKYTSTIIYNIYEVCIYHYIYHILSIHLHVNLMCFVSHNSSCSTCPFCTGDARARAHPCGGSSGAEDRAANLGGGEGELSKAAGCYPLVMSK